jgi:uncharacterized metal-binding protein YceD (DUF177 family)
MNQPQHKNLNSVKAEEQQKVKISNRFADLETLNDNKVFNIASET